MERASREVYPQNRKDFKVPGAKNPRLRAFAARACGLRRLPIPFEAESSFGPTLLPAGFPVRLALAAHRPT
jgi:hypothetical protein